MTRNGINSFNIFLHVRSLHSAKYILKTRCFFYRNCEKITYVSFSISLFHYSVSVKIKKNQLFLISVLHIYTVYRPSIHSLMYLYIIRKYEMYYVTYQHVMTRNSDHKIDQTQKHQFATFQVDGKFCTFSFLHQNILWNVIVEQHHHILQMLYGKEGKFLN